MKRFLGAGGLPRGRMLIGLDFDGTLSPLVSHPHRARLSSGMRRLLARMTKTASIRLAVVSGRNLMDVRKRIGLKGIHYAGNHGLEIQGPGLRWTHPKARQALRRVQSVARGLRRELRSIPGALLEDKGLSLSVHYRRTPPGRLPELRRLLRRAIAPHSDSLELGSGKKIWEVRPKTGWNKGHALLKIARSIGGVRRLAFVGDDRTDEDGFRTLGRRALTVRVGPAGRSAARLRLGSQRQVRGLLELLSRRP